MAEEEHAALIVTRRPAKEMADGTLRVQIDVEPNDRRMFLDMFPDNGDPIAVVKLDPETVRKHQNQTAFAEVEKKPEKGDQGQFARWLVSSGFFRNPKVWKFCGTDDEFCEWVKQQRCVIYSIADDRCDGDIVAAHVRRVASGAGTGIKPEYAVVPLCNKHHCQQHQHGESNWFGDVSEGKEWFDKQRITTVSAWAQIKLKEKAGVITMTKLTPYHLESLLRDTGINVNIPTEYL
jgi:hypothetical protein